MTALLILAAALLVAVLVSRFAARTAASVALLFIGVGMAAGQAGFGLIEWQPDAPAVEHVATLALLAVLLADGTRIGIPDLRACWRLPGRALLLGMPITLALLRSRLALRHRLAAAWFGPKGFASLIYAVLVLRSGVPDAERLFHLAALVIALSIAAHSTTDVPLARWLQRRRGAAAASADTVDGKHKKASRACD